MSKLIPSEADLVLEKLEVSIFPSANNLICFYSIPPEDQSVGFVFDGLGSNITNVFPSRGLIPKSTIGNLFMTSMV